jgi:hypothetical protein
MTHRKDFWGKKCTKVIRFWEKKIRHPILDGSFISKLGCQNIVGFLKKKGVCGLVAIYIKKYLKAKKRRIMETQIFHHAKI